MSAELQTIGNGTGKTLYFLIRNRIGQVWDTVDAAFETYATASYSGYVISATEQGTAANYYVGNFPSAIAAGYYNVVSKQQTGVNPAETDPNVSQGIEHWGGSTLMPLSDLATSGQIGQFLPLQLPRGVAISGYTFRMVSSADHVTAFTSGVISGQISRDGGSFGALQSGLIAGAYTEMGLGFFKVNLTSGDLNGKVIALNFQGVGISGGAADQINHVLYMQRVSGTLI